MTEPGSSSRMTASSESKEPTYPCIYVTT
jgi:hypothetical protein